MRFRTLMTFAMACGVVTAYFAGCGSDDEKPPATPTTEAGTDATTEGGGGSDTGTTDSASDVLVDANTCKVVGQQCTSSTQCCSAQCDSVSGMCVNKTGCDEQGTACTESVDCCSLSCVGGQCSGLQCLSDNQPCTSNEQCCGQLCTGPDGGAKTCTPLNGGCKTAGNTCQQNSDCCSHVCNSGLCMHQPSFCTQTGDICRTDFECCGGRCAKAAGRTVGVCEVVDAPGASGCLVTGQVCSDAPSIDDGGAGDSGVPSCGGACCSRSCGPYGPTGVNICQPPSGCRPTGEVCRTGEDCCGFGGTQGVTGTGECSIVGDASVGRCDNGNACRPAGAICKLKVTSCNAENNCCAGNVNQDPWVCQQDNLGIPRCTMGGQCADGGVGSAADGGSLVGKACASSADCCGLPCVPNSDGGLPAFVCGAQCRPLGSSCSSSADCCTGIPCVQLPGSTDGVCGGEIVPDSGTVQPPLDSGTPPVDGGVAQCALPGQSCTVDANCCNSASYKCRNGTCRIPIN